MFRLIPSKRYIPANKFLDDREKSREVEHILLTYCDTATIQKAERAKDKWLTPSTSFQFYSRNQMSEIRE